LGYLLENRPASGSHLWLCCRFFLCPKRPCIPLVPAGLFVVLQACGPTTPRLGARFHLIEYDASGRKRGSGRKHLDQLPADTVMAGAVETILSHHLYRDANKRRKTYERWLKRDSASQS